ncbi:hypothetical protein Moror_8749 [Moniliophthora roreri MCA 2997]|uniref:Uncharacterized protein n=1 Tax=Moniliophthora roreri (strain MCA 2997) TaxID=1381753 RepID=V2WKW2_MONRO|nr:hypothetical protein Moror_8749 [Moniliophthora roreri MCA 2997]
MANFFQGDIQCRGIVQYKGRKGGKKGEGEVNNAFLVIKTSGQGVAASNINRVYQGLSNVNTFSDPRTALVVKNITSSAQTASQLKSSS